MDIPTLILLGAAGGLLRGVLDVYTRFVSWQADRRVHRQSAAAGTAYGEAPRFQVYFDPAVDIVAAGVHSVMGAGAAVLFGTTGQVSGEYAALVVGMSAPMLLTQLGRIQTVNEAVTGARQPAGAEETATETGAASAAGAVGAGGADASGAAEEAVGAAAATAFTAPPGAEPPPSAPPAHPVQPLATAEESQPSVRGMPTPRQPADVTDARTREPAPDSPADRTRSTEPTGFGETPSPLGPADGTGPGFDGRRARRWRQGPAVGEEGL